MLGSRASNYTVDFETDNLGRYCEGDENEDPSEDFEEMLACSSCEDKCELKFTHKLDIYNDRGLADVAAVPAAHRQCAREANSLDSDDSKYTSHLFT